MAEPSTTNPAGSSAWPHAIAHLDMDAYYVNVYLLDHQQDRGMPLAVGGRPGSRGVVMSASYEARAFGVRSAMPANRALRRCPKLKFVSVDWDRIHECSDQVMDILRSHGVTQPVSVDEAFVDLSEQAEPPAVARKMQATVLEKTGLPCSVGLATTRLVAKVASDFEKPAGCTIVAPGTEAEFLAPMNTRALWGIGPKMAERLRGLDIHSCGQLASADIQRLKAGLGNYALELQAMARGIDHSQVRATRGDAKSISNERTFTRDSTDEEYLKNIVEELSCKVGSRLREAQLVARTVTLKLRYRGFDTYTRQKSLKAALDSDNDTFRLVWGLLTTNLEPERPVRLIGVGVSKLSPRAEQRLPIYLEGGADET